MTTLGVGSFNTVMGENRNAENDAILNNANNLLNYHADQKSDKLIEEGENEKIGATDAGAATSTPLEAAGESTADATSGAADVGATAAKTTEEIATSTATKVAGKAAFWGGKALGNVGGAIDLVKDIQSSAAGGSFLAGTGKSTTDEVGNGLELAGSVLDVAGIALPFLEPLGAALTIAGGLTSTVGGLTDQTTMENKTTGDYNKGNVSMPVPQGSAGLGFIASAPTNPMKQITGSSTF